MTEVGVAAVGASGSASAGPLTGSGAGTDPDSSIIAIRDAYKGFLVHDRVTWAMRGVSLSVARGEFVAIVGPSGCGKSTLLNLVAGLMPPTQGAVGYGGRAVAGPNTSVGYMTQKDDLLPWRTAQRNLMLPLETGSRRASTTRKQRSDLVAGMMQTLGLQGFESHYPALLSGGMRKRVALGRTLLADPETLLLDEPFSALDAQLRIILQNELLSLVAARHITVVLVTHDLDEAIAMADRVIVMTSRPARVKLDKPVPIKRPRDVISARSDPNFVPLREELWSALSPEIEVRKEPGR
jgi:NitT/TauT family transport system ATP-binding protein